MHWLQTIDVELFRFLNLKLINPVFDQVMPFLSGNAFFIPVLVLAGLFILWKGRARGVVFLLMLVLAVALTDGFVCRNLKHAIGRERPFLALADVHCLIGKSGSGSMPSSHAANWFAAVMVALVYYRRSLWVLLPGAVLVSFSRIYNGVHYPSDVLAGAILGAGTAAATLWLVNSLWQWIGRKWFPLWWERLPSLLEPRVRDEFEEELAVPPPTRGIAPAEFEAPHVSLDAHWVRLGYVVIGVLLLARLFYLASGTIQLSEDEAYQWVWSKHLALSYFSKPPLIAYTQFLGTSLWGDTAFGVRFFSPIIAAIIGVMLLRFFAREVNARAGFFLLLIITATPLMGVGAVLMTIDPLSVLFWTAAMLAGWRAAQPNGTTRDWLWVGLWMGLGFLSKYTELFQWLCWAVFFALWPPARKHLRRPGPYLALLINCLCATPVLIWNAQHNWITVTHVASDAGAGQPWHPTLRFLVDFLGSELLLLNPVFFVATVWTAIVLWRRHRHNPRLVYFFSMGAPLFLAYLLHSFRSRVLPNWIAPSVLPLFIMVVIYWDARWRLGASRIKP
ncbi:MAG TPA: glycosyltransferase family 39 protein, partial [Candidatus Sulfotelmatobacter sp.]|nr:glycosyltransferase family 39 protein [Candidatus Sulfotelmatobacter sp.]